MLSTWLQVLVGGCHAAGLELGRAGGTGWGTRALAVGPIRVGAAPHCNATAQYVSTLHHEHQLRISARATHL